MPLSPRSLAPIIENAFPINGLSKETFDNLSLYIPHPKYCFTDTSRSIQCNKDDNVALFLNSNNKNTNVLMNPNMYGAIPGTPGSSPIGWGVFTSPGISREIVAVGSELVNGVNTPYVDVRFFGTATAGGSNGFDPSPISGIPANIGDRWTVSVYLKLISANGTMPSNSYIMIPEVGSNSAILLSETQNIGGSVLNNSTYTRVSRSKTFSSPSVKFASFFIRTVLAINETIDFTIRIAAPMLEKLATPSANYNVSQIAYQLVTGNQPKLRKGSKNWISNSTFAGASVVSNINPSLWASTTGSGISRSVTALGTEVINGKTYNYIDYRFSGTATVLTSTTLDLMGGLFPAMSGQKWCFSCFMKAMAGTQTLNASVTLAERNSGGTMLANTRYGFDALTNNYQQIVVARNLNQATTTQAQLQIRYDPAVLNETIDFTIRIAAPMLELGTLTPSEFSPSTDKQTSNGVGNWWLDFDGVQTSMIFNEVNYDYTQPLFIGYSGISFRDSAWQSGINLGNRSAQFPYLTVGITNIGRSRVTFFDSIGNNVTRLSSTTDSNKTIVSSGFYNLTNLILRNNGIQINNLTVTNIASSTLNSGVIGATLRQNQYSDYYNGRIFSVFMVKNIILTNTEIFSIESYIGKLAGVSI